MNAREVSSCVRTRLCRPELTSAPRGPGPAGPTEWSRAGADPVHRRAQAGEPRTSCVRVPAEHRQRPQRGGGRAVRPTSRRWLVPLAACSRVSSRVGRVRRGAHPRRRRQRRVRAKVAASPACRSLLPMCALVEDPLEQVEVGVGGSIIRGVPDSGKGLSTDGRLWVPPCRCRKGVLTCANAILSVTLQRALVPHCGPRFRNRTAVRHPADQRKHQDGVVRAAVERRSEKTVWSRMNVASPCAAPRDGVVDDLVGAAPRNGLMSLCGVHMGVGPFPGRPRHLALPTDQRADALAGTSPPRA
jgi:hypothetical protein